MKRIIMMLVAVFFCISSFAQEFEFSKVVQAKGTPSELFSKAKDFVSQTYNSAKNVIQNEDDKANILLVKARHTKEYAVGMGLTCVYTYEYSFKIQCREGRCKIDVFDISCIEANQEGLGTVNEIPKIQPFFGEETEQKTKSMGRGLSKKKAAQMMKDLQEDFNALISACENRLNEQEEEW